MDGGQLSMLILLALACLSAVVAIGSELLSRDVDRDGPKLKAFARNGTIGAAAFAILALSVGGIGSMMRPPVDPRIGQAEKPGPAASASADTSAQTPVASPSPPPMIQVGAPIPQPQPPAAPQTLPTFASSAPRTTPNPPMMGGGNYQWNTPGATGDRGPNDDLDTAPKPAKVLWPYTPITFKVVLRFSSEDPAIRRYVDRVVRQAEHDSGIALASSQDKFASVHIVPGAEVVYADGQQAELPASTAYVAQENETAAREYLFTPSIYVTVSRPDGDRATFSKQVNWFKVRPDEGTDLLDVYVFPHRKRVVLTVTASCLPSHGEFAEGAPSVYDLRGGTVAAQLLRAGDGAMPKLVDLDDVDLSAADESDRLPAPLAPRIRPTIVSIVCATTPPGRVELGAQDATIQRSAQDHDALEVCGPVALEGFPADPPAR